MAIASVVIQGAPDNLQAIMRALHKLHAVCDCQIAALDKIAASVESPADKLLDALQKIEHLNGVWNLELVYVNYEDDLDEKGAIPCPPLAELQKKMRNK